MATKTRIGLCLFFNNTTNSGIVNYIYNIVAALKLLPPADQPTIILIHNETASINLIRSAEYKNLKFLLLKKNPTNFYAGKINSLLYQFTGKNYYLNWFICKKFDVLYPYFPFVNDMLSAHPNKIEWLVDFNNVAFPDHYDDKGASMKEYQEKLTEKKSKIVLSSYALFEELKKYYPSFRNEVKILRFASSLPQTDNLHENDVKNKHKIDQPYYMSPNQFWQHKNQAVVLESIYMLKRDFPSLPFKVLFTGSLEVNRGKGLYVEKLRKLVASYCLEEYVQFLGILDRTEQLLLMRGSIALIQPSLYEGWSTLVEEAKALNKLIIVSDIPVHREQISQNAIFFDPNDAKQLSVIMKEVYVNPAAVANIDYKQNIKSFANKIVETLC